MTQRTGQREIGAQGAPEGGPTGRGEEVAGFDALRTMPRDVPRKSRQRWERLAGRCRTSHVAAIELKCLECCAWDRPEVKRCEISGCPLWAANRRIFRKNV